MRRLLLLLVTIAGLSGATAGRADAYVYWINGSGSSTTIARGNNDGGALDIAFIPVPAGTAYIAINDRFIYWTGGGSIGRANIGGSSINQDFITGQSTITGLTATATKLYWASTVSQAQNFVRSADADGSNVNTAVVSEPDGFFDTELATTGSYLFRQLFQNGNSASADLFRTDLAGGGSDGGHFVSPTSHNAILRGLTTDASHLYAIRVGVGPSGDQTYPITVGGLDGASFSSLVPGDGPPRFGLAQTGCRLYWSNRAGTLTVGGGPAPAAIDTALVDGTQVKTQLMTAGVVTPGAMAADLLPAEKGDCATAAPPPVTPPVMDPTPAPTATVAPGPVATPPPPVFTPQQLMGLTDKQLEALDETYAEIIYYNAKTVPDFLKQPHLDLEAELDRRMWVDVEAALCNGRACANIFNPGFLDTLLPRPASRSLGLAARAAKPHPLFLGRTSGADAATSTATPASLTTGASQTAKVDKALDGATARAARAHGAKAKKKARNALKKARAGVKKLHLRRLALTALPGGRATVRKLRSRLAHGKTVKIQLLVRMTDPRNGATASTQRTVTLRPPGKRSRR